MRWRRIVGIAAAATALAVPTGASPATSPGRPFEEGDVALVGLGTTLLDRNGNVVTTLRADVAPLTTAFGHSNRWLYIAGTPPTVRQYQTTVLRGNVGVWPDGTEITAVADAPDGSIVVATSQGRYLHQLYRIEQPSGLTPTPVVIRDRVVSLDVAANDCTVVYATAAGAIKRRDVRGQSDGCENRAFPDYASRVRATGIKLLGDGSLLASGRGGVRRIAAGGRVLMRYPTPGGGDLAAVDLAPDGTSFWTATPTGEAYRIDLASGRVLLGPIPTGRNVLDIAVLGSPFGAAPAATPVGEAGAVALDGVAPLTGEALVENALAAFTPPQPCGAGGGSLALAAANQNGEATGPYPGSFTARAAVTYGPQTLPEQSGFLGVAPGRVSSLSGDFAISGMRPVRGTFAVSPDAAATAVCTAFQRQTFPHAFTVPPDYPISGYYENAAGTLTYVATIAAGDRTYTASGTSQLFVDEYNTVLPGAPADACGYKPSLPPPSQRGCAGNAIQWTQQFVSGRIGVADVVSGVGQQRSHTSTIGRDVKRVELIVRWQRPTDRFALTGLRLLKPPRTLAAAAKLRPGKLRISVKKLGRTGLRIGISKLRPGRLVFAIRAMRISGATSLHTELRMP